MTTKQILCCPFCFLKKILYIDFFFALLLLFLFFVVAVTLFFLIMRKQCLLRSTKAVPLCARVGLQYLHQEPFALFELHTMLQEP